MINPPLVMDESARWLILGALLIPLVSFFINLIIRARYAWLCSLLSPLLLLIAALLAASIVSVLWSGPGGSISFTWFQSGPLVIQAGFYVDKTTLVLFLAVPSISFLVHAYSAGYMAGDPGIRRYFALMGLFTFSMLNIVLAPNLLFLFVFWELVGFCSYMLIGHWHERPGAGAAALKAFLFNRVGDAGLLIGLLVLWNHYGTLHIDTLRALSPTGAWATAASLLVLCGVAGKSAQFPLFTWLPDAMVGPTPVSALIHAATMVAAGVFLLVRLSFLFTPDALLVVAVVGGVTALFGAAVALSQFDMKKILAYSTISQLGMMVAAVGVGAHGAALAHLFTHGFFKAGLFLGVGSVAHAIGQSRAGITGELDAWDVRNLGGLWRKLPVTFGCLLACGASLAGLPFTSGSFSKEAILGAFISSNHMVSSGETIVFLAVYAASFLTVLYIFRLMILVFITPPRVELWPREAPPVMRVPLVALAILSLFPVISLNPFASSSWLLNPQGEEHLQAVSMVWTLLALGTAYLYYRWKKKPVAWPAAGLLGTLPDRIYHYAIVGPVLRLSHGARIADRRVIDGILHAIVMVDVTIAHVINWIDQVIIDGFFVEGVARLTRSLGSIARSFQAGRVQRYVLWSLVGIFVFLFWILLQPNV